MTEERNHNLQKEIDKGTCDSLIYQGKVHGLIITLLLFVQTLANFCLLINRPGVAGAVL